jgi:acetoin utilization deacetylase AcuC-like enzyme
MSDAGIYLRHPSSFEHDTGGHPENAGRLRAIEAALGERDWLGLEVVEAPAATREQLLRVHPQPHIEAIEEIARRGGGMIDMDTVTSAGSYVAALHSAGAAVAAVDRVIGGGADFAFCGTRPPGHHAEAARAMGFCLFNNIAVAAEHALAEHGAGRVAVIDWDVHHGNGTEAIFYESDRVLYASIHESPLYPGTGARTDTGTGPGEGWTLNMPVRAGAAGDEFLEALNAEILPAVRRAEPGLIAISAGYDAHSEDPLASCALLTEDYGEMTALVRGAAAELGAPVIVCLEGGYAPAALAASVVATLEALAQPHSGDTA